MIKNLDIALERLKNQQLVSANMKRPVDVVHWLGAVQAQDYNGAKWALGVRMHDPTDQGLEEAFAAGEILRTHVMRPTWHFVAPADIRWLLKLTAPRVNAANAHYYRKLELDEIVFKRTNKAITNALLGGKQLTRDELRSVIQRSDVTVDDALRFNYMLIRAELDGLVCSGARHGKQFTYALLDERVPETKDRSREEALADLTVRYFTSHGPATLADFIWWSGLAAKDANTGLEMVQRQLVKAEVEGRSYWRSSSRPSVKRTPRLAHLLPAFDEYLVSYKERSAAFEYGDSKKTTRGNMIFSPVIVIGGRVVGSWKRSPEGKSVRIMLSYFTPVTKTEGQLVADAAHRYGEYLGMRVVI